MGILKPATSVPLEIEPDLITPRSPYALTLTVDNSLWPARKEMTAICKVRPLGLPAQQFTLKLFLVENEHLSFGQSTVWEQELLLGHAPDGSLKAAATGYEAEERIDKPVEAAANG